MLNQVVLVGRLLEIKETDENSAIIIISVPRSFKDENGIYQNDNINCEILGTIKENTIKYCNKGDLVGIKARIQTDVLNDGEIKMKIVADKITFLSSKAIEEEE